MREGWYTDVERIQHLGRQHLLMTGIDRRVATSGLHLGPLLVRVSNRDDAHIRKTKQVAQMTAGDPAGTDEADPRWRHMYLLMVGRSTALYGLGGVDVGMVVINAS